MIGKDLSANPCRKIVLGEPCLPKTISSEIALFVERAKFLACHFAGTVKKHVNSPRRHENIFANPKNRGIEGNEL